MNIEEQIVNLINLVNTFIGEAPPNTDICQWIKEIGGKSLVHFNKTTYDYPNYIIYVRDKKNQDAKKTIMDIYHKLENYSDACKSIIVKRLPSFIGRDLLNRSVYSFQIEIQLGGF